MTSSSINNDRMFLSTMSTPRRPSRIPALMTKSLHAPRFVIRVLSVDNLACCRSMSTPGMEVHGSGEQLCEGYRSMRAETQDLLCRSQEKRKQRASSYDPRWELISHRTSEYHNRFRCLLVLHPSNRLSTSASASTSLHHQLMASSISHSNPNSYSRLLNKRPQWIRHQPTPPLAESTVSLESLKIHPKPQFALDFDPEWDLSSGSEEEDDNNNDSGAVTETPRARKSKKKGSIWRLKDRNRKKFRIRCPQRHHNPPESRVLPPEFHSVTSPFFYFSIAFLFRILIFLMQLLQLLFSSD